MKGLQVDPEIYKKKFIYKSYYQTNNVNAKDEHLGHPVAFAMRDSSLMAYFMGFGWREFRLLEMVLEDEE